MKKKKNNNDFIIISAVALVLALFLGLNFGFAMYDVEVLEQQNVTESESKDKLSLTVDYFEEELQKVTIKDFRWNDTVKKPIFIMAFIWFIAVAYYSSSQKNLITGKEYGTARWGTQNDIRDLFAENVKKKEIDKVMRISHFWSRSAVKKEIKQYCKKYAKEHKQQEIEKLRKEYERKIKLLEDDVN